MAYHGGGLEENTDVIAREAAAMSGASYYGVLQPESLQLPRAVDHGDAATSRRPSTSSSIMSTS